MLHTFTVTKIRQGRWQGFSSDGFSGSVRKRGRGFDVEISDVSGALVGVALHKTETDAVAGLVAVLMRDSRS